MKFEAHITFHRDHAETVKSVGEDHRWSFSQIDGDPVMGKQAYCYLTAYDTDAHDLHMSMEACADALRSRGVPVLRTKIEAIVFDSKTGVNELSFRSELYVGGL